MKKVISILIGVSAFIYANSCSDNEIQNANNIFKESRFEQNLDKKVDLLFKAKKVCSLPQIEIEIKKILISENISKLTNETFGDIETDLNNLSNKNDRLNNKLHIYKFNSKKEINKLFIDLYKKQKEKGIIRNLNNKLANFENLHKEMESNTMKSLEDVGGMYKSDLRFQVNSYVIINIQEADKLVRAIENIIFNQSDAIFTVTGYASSDGDADKNYILSQNRADSFIQLVKSKNIIKKFAKGESMLVCNDDLLAEEDAHGEYRCTFGEDRDASRRVVIRRVK